MLDIINNPYFIIFFAGIVFCVIYVVFRPETIPAFIFLLLSSLGAFYEAAAMQQIALLKAIILPLLLIILILMKFIKRDKMPMPIGALLLLFIYGTYVIVNSMIHGAQMNDYRAYFGILLIPAVVAFCPDKEKTVKYLTIAFAIWGAINMIEVVATWSGRGWAKAYSAGDAFHTSHRSIGLMGHSTLMGVYFGIAINAAHVLYYQAKSRFSQILLLGLGIVLVIGLMGTLSRGAIAGWLLSFLYIQYRFRGLNIKNIIVVIVFGIIVLGLSSLLNIDDIMLTRYAGMRSDPSAQNRLPLLEMGKQLLNRDPLFGVGLAQGGKVHLEAHNTFMQVLMENGIIGFTLFCLVLWKGVHGLRKREGKGKVVVSNPMMGYYIGLFGTIGSILFNAVFHVFDYLMPLWLILGFGFMVL